MTRLEQVVSEMDSPTLPLEQLIRHYEEGVKLVKVCEEKLQDAERKIELITRKAQDQPQLEAFDPAAKNAPGQPPAGPRQDVSLF